MKPMLACDWDESRLRFPVIAQPKIDGVRALGTAEGLVGRSLKPFKNQYSRTLYRHSEFAGLDGELMLGDSLTSPSLCRDTTAALNTVAGEPALKWVIFDRVQQGVPYIDRLRSIRHLAGVIESRTVEDLPSLLRLESEWLEQGYEGVILRDPRGGYKYGRSTVKEGGLLRIKRFVEEDAVVLGVIEGRVNLNPAEINLLGRTERSTHAENMVASGQIGALSCRCLATGAHITVGAGGLTVADRILYFQHPEKILGVVVKYRHFPHGAKDLPRFPTFHSFRD